ncbi:MAG: 50S ribosomal protein L23 [Candidatus Aenigmarchaeota archaeon]|nr:50S ribosomal protein L23 [Candidatus Aenigmarchaeota archaeon]
MAKEKEEEKEKAVNEKVKGEKKPAAAAKEKKSIKEKVMPKKEKKEAKAEQGDARQIADAFDVVKFVLMTEKSIRMVESQNKLVFIVNRSSKKSQIRKSIELAFGSPVSGVKTVIDQSGRKKAFVKFSNAGAAGDIAIKLGII